MLVEALIVSAGLSAWLYWVRRTRWQAELSGLSQRAVEASTDEELARVAWGFAMLLEGPLPRRVLPSVRLAQAYVLTSAGRYEEALAALDAIPLRGLSSDQTALWLNNRAYALALMGRSDEALDHLDDASAIVTEGGLEDAQLQSCLHGTRGIALLHAGALDEAEQELRTALELGGTLPSPAEPVDLANVDRERLMAERYYWLAEVAAARQQRDEAVACLRLAAELPGTPFGRRALERLAALG